MKNKEEVVSIVIDLLQTENISFTEFEELLPEIKKSFLQRVSISELKKMKDLAQKLGHQNEFAFENWFLKKYRKEILKIINLSFIPVSAWCSNLWFSKYFYIGFGDWGLRYCEHFILVEIKQDDKKTKFNIVEKCFSSLNELKSYMQQNI